MTTADPPREQERSRGRAPEPTGFEVDAFMRPAHWLAGRLVGVAGVAFFTALAPGVGPNRWWLVAALLAIFVPATFAIERWVTPRATAQVQALTDAAGCMLFVHFVPQHWHTVLVIGVITVTANVSALGARWFYLTQFLMCGGLGLAAVMHGVDGWVLPLAAVIVVSGPVASYASWLQSQDALFASRLQDMTRTVAAIVWEADPESGCLLQVIGPTADVTGHEADAFAQLYPHALVHTDDMDLIGRALPADGSRVERSLRVRHADGRWIWLREVIGLVEAADGRQYVRGVAFDITDLQEARHALARKAERDDLTGLYGRAAIHLELQRRLASTTDPVGVLLMDLDGFKNINDTMGHPTGDELLKVHSQRLAGIARSTDVVGRLGGDEFMVVTTGADVSELAAFAHRVIEAMSRPAVIGGVEMMCGVSVGVALSPDHGTTPDDLIRNADHAMYAAKRSGHGLKVFEGREESGSMRRMARLAELTRGLEDQVELWFMPIVDAATGRQVSMEGLARWRHPTDGILPPAEFLDLVESAGLTVRFDNAMVRRAIERIARLGPDSDLTVSVNVSQRGLADRSFVRRVRKQLGAVGVAPQRLTVEISERDVDSDQRSVLGTLAELRAMGVGISLDDFGTGYSSLSRLRGLPITEIKIDHGFVTVMTDSPADEIIVRSTAEMARELGMSVVAEGVANEAIEARLRELGCDRLQGFLFGEATPDGLLSRDDVPSPPSTTGSP